MPKNIIESSFSLFTKDKIKNEWFEFGLKNRNNDRVWQKLTYNESEE